MMLARGAEYDWECRLVVLLHKQNIRSWQENSEEFIKTTYVIADGVVGVVQLSSRVIDNQSHAGTIIRSVGGACLAIFWIKVRLR